ncbi:glycine cleavage system protein GcvH [Euzebya pacifica]|uniref:glycine cleavage system protein GcvH n=1 Tax=Euzebya pacifica TaxID=1608957 RepID=UPI0030FBE2FD
MSFVPEDRSYHPEHHWARQEEGLVVVGVTDFAQEALGDVIWAELPEVGAVMERDRAFAELESSKVTSEVYGPVNGTVVARNEAVLDAPELVNQDPYNEAWLVKVDVASVDLGHLLTPAQYREMLQSQ